MPGFALEDMSLTISSSSSEPTAAAPSKESLREEGRGEKGGEREEERKEERGRRGEEGEEERMGRRKERGKEAKRREE